MVSTNGVSMNGHAQADANKPLNGKGMYSQ